MLVVSLQRLTNDPHAMQVAPGLDALVGRVVLDAVRGLDQVCRMFDALPKCFG